MINRIKEYFESTLDWLRDTSYSHSLERSEFAAARIKGQKDYMAGLTRFSPYLQFEEWDKRR